MISNMIVGPQSQTQSEEEDSAEFITENRPMPGSFRSKSWFFDPRTILMHVSLKITIS